jgi:hypothetical protein
MGNPPYKEILEAIKDLGSKTSEAIQYQSVSIALNGKGIRLSTEEVHELCRAMHYIVPGDIYALEKTVELVRRPDMVLADIKNMAIDEAGKNSSIKI